MLSPFRALEYWRDLVARQAQLLEGIASAADDPRWLEIAERFHAAADALQLPIARDDER